MSKKSSTFALEMEMNKKSYIQPITEIAAIETKQLMEMDHPSGKPTPAPPVNAPVF